MIPAKVQQMQDATNTFCAALTELVKSAVHQDVPICIIHTELHLQAQLCLEVLAQAAVTRKDVN